MIIKKSLTWIYPSIDTQETDKHKYELVKHNRIYNILKIYFIYFQIKKYLNKFMVLWISVWKIDINIY